MRYTLEQIWKTYSDGGLGLWVNRERQTYIERLRENYGWHILNAANDLGEDWKSSANQVLEAQKNGAKVDLDSLADLRDLYQIFCDCLNQIAEQRINLSGGRSAMNPYEKLSPEILKLIQDQCKVFISAVSPLFKIEVNDWGRAQSGYTDDDVPR
jgi:hypothetical protein